MSGTGSKRAQRSTTVANEEAEAVALLHAVALFRPRRQSDWQQVADAVVAELGKAGARWAQFAYQPQRAKTQYELLVAQYRIAVATNGSQSVIPTSSVLRELLEKVVAGEDAASGKCADSAVDVNEGYSSPDDFICVYHRRNDAVDREEKQQASTPRNRPDARQLDPHRAPSSAPPPATTSSSARPREPHRQRSSEPRRPSFKMPAVSQVSLVSLSLPSTPAIVVARQSSARKRQWDTRLTASRRVVRRVELQRAAGGADGTSSPEGASSNAAVAPTSEDNDEGDIAAQDHGADGSQDSQDQADQPDVVEDLAFEHEETTEGVSSDVLRHQDASSVNSLAEPPHNEVDDSGGDPQNVQDQEEQSAVVEDLAFGPEEPSQDVSTDVLPHQDTSSTNSLVKWTAEVHKKVEPRAELRPSASSPKSSVPVDHGVSVRNKDKSGQDAAQQRVVLAPPLEGDESNQDSCLNVSERFSQLLEAAETGQSTCTSEELNTEVVNLKDQVLSLVQSVKVLEITAQTQHEMLKFQERKLERLDSSNHHLMDELATLKRACATGEKVIEAKCEALLARAREDAESREGKLVFANTVLKETVRFLQARIQTLEADVSNHETLHKTQTARVDASDAKWEVFARTFAKADNTDALTQAVDSYRKWTENAKREQEELVNHLQRTCDEVVSRGLERAQQQLEPRLAGPAQELEALGIRVKDVECAMQRLGSFHHGHLTRFDSKLKALEQSAVEADTRLEVLNDRLITEADRVDTQELTHQALETKVRECEEAVACVKKRVEEANARHIPGTAESTREPASSAMYRDLQQTVTTLQATVEANKQANAKRYLDVLITIKSILESI